MQIAAKVISGRLVCPRCGRISSQRASPSFCRQWPFICEACGAMDIISLTPEEAAQLRAECRE